jgi:hypothetical protein
MSDESPVGVPQPGPRPAAQPPAGLLEELLEQASHPGVKGRAAVPVRGAVTGARPLLSAALLVGGAAVGGGVGYACWRTTQRLRTLGARSAA